MMFVVQNVAQGAYSGLFWSNELGWVGIDDADMFSEAERAHFELPAGSEWVASEDSDLLRFAFVIAGCELAGAFDDYLLDKVQEFTNLTKSQVFDLVERAVQISERFGKSPSGDCD